VARPVQRKTAKQQESVRWQHRGKVASFPSIAHSIRGIMLIFYTFKHQNLPK
jgi:hypothetical protein